MEASIQETATPHNRSGRSRKTPPRHLISSTKDNCNSQKCKGGKETSRAFWIMSPLHCKSSTLRTPAGQKDNISLESNMELEPEDIDKSNEHTIKQRIRKSVITPHTPYTPLPATSQHDISLQNKVSATDNSLASHEDYSQRTSFPEAVHNMVVETDKNVPDVIHWILDGEAFVIREKDKRLGQILKKHFRHGKYSSLQRQLNMYGWKKHMTGRYAGAFHNPEFHREVSRGNLNRILRRGPPCKSRRKKGNKTSPKIKDENLDLDHTSESLTAQACKRRSCRQVKVHKQLTPEKQTKGKQFENGNPFLSVDMTSEDSISVERQKVQSLDPLNAVPIVLEDGLSNPFLKDWTPQPISRKQTRRSTRSLLSSEDEASPTDTWSPFIPGIMQESTTSICELETYQHNMSGIQGADGVNSPMDKYSWSQWRKNCHFRSNGVSSRKESFRGDTTPQVIHQEIQQYTNCDMKLQDDFSKIDGRRMNIPKLTTVSSPNVAYSSESWRCLSPNFSNRQPSMLSVESFDVLPISLMRQISSSFYLPFVGMTESLSYALGIPHEIDQAITPSRIKSHNGDE